MVKVSGYNIGWKTFINVFHPILIYMLLMEFISLEDLSLCEVLL